MRIRSVWKDMLCIDVTYQDTFMEWCLLVNSMILQYRHVPGCVSLPGTNSTPVESVCLISYLSWTLLNPH